MKNINVLVPSDNEIIKIINLLIAFNNLIEDQFKKIGKLKKRKKRMLQLMLF